MITNIYGTSPYITVSSSINGPYISPGAASAGLVRYHNSQTQVYDGNAWLALGGSSSVGLSSNAEQALGWAIKKMTQEKAAQDLAKKHPTVADALDAVRLAEQQLQTVVALCTV
jgi:hypothetical protein